MGNCLPLFDISIRDLPCLQTRQKHCLQISARKNLFHMEMIQTMVYMLTKDADIEEIKESDMGGYYAIRDKAIYPADSTGNP